MLIFTKVKKQIKKFVIIEPVEMFEGIHVLRIQVVVALGILPHPESAFVVIVGRTPRWD